VTAQHTGRHGPRYLQLADIAGVDLLQIAPPALGVVAGLRGSVRRVAHFPIEIGVGDSRGERKRRSDRRYSDQYGS
jgi:hypothetical protein